MFCFKAAFVAPALTKCLAVITWHNSRRVSDLHYNAMWLFASCLVINGVLVVTTRNYIRYFIVPDWNKAVILRSN